MHLQLSADLLRDREPDRVSASELQEDHRPAGEEEPHPGRAAGASATAAAVQLSAAVGRLQLCDHLCALPAPVHLQRALQSPGHLSGVPAQIVGGPRLREHARLRAHGRVRDLRRTGDQSFSEIQKRRVLPELHLRARSVPYQYRLLSQIRVLLHPQS